MAVLYCTVLFGVKNTTQHVTDESSGRKYGVKRRVEFTGPRDSDVRVKQKELD